jgi:hypothetical protein
LTASDFPVDSFTVTDGIQSRKEGERITERERERERETGENSAAPVCICAANCSKRVHFVLSESLYTVYATVNPRASEAKD